MPQSLASIILHIVFSTKNRSPVLYASVRPALFAYMAEVSREIGCECYRVGGVEDHVHIAVGLSRTISVAQYVEVVKNASSKWLKKQSALLHNFSWQRGYGAFSVRKSGLDQLVRYINRQEEHHRKRSFKHEYIRVLKQSGVDYDERFVWD